MRRWVLLLTALLVGAPLPSHGAEAVEGATGPPQRVLVVAEPPFVVRDGERWSGWAIDLWTEVARQAGIDWQISGTADQDDIVAALAAGRADVGVGDITVTRERAGRIDFSHPFFRTGLRLLVSEGRASSLWDTLGELATPTHVRLGLGLLVLLAGMSVLIYALARRHDTDNFPENRAEGVVEAVYVAAGALLKGQLDRRLLPGVFNRVLTIVWMFLGTAVVAYFTAAVAAVVTVRRLDTGIQGLDDLRGSPVAAVVGTFEVDWLRRRGFEVITVNDVDAGAASVTSGQSRALVHSAPALAWWVARHPTAEVDVIDNSFERAYFAFALQHQSPLRLRINVALLALEESGFLEELDRRWLGAR